MTFISKDVKLMCLYHRWWVNLESKERQSTPPQMGLE